MLIYSVHSTFTLRPKGIEIKNRGDPFFDVIKHVVQIEKATQQSKNTQITYIKI